VPAGSLTKTEDIQGFTERLLYVTEDDLRYICKPCHAIVTLSERRGISFEEAKVEKQVIEFGKGKAAEQYATLAEMGAGKITSARGRKDKYRELINDR